MSASFRLKLAVFLALFCPLALVCGSDNPSSTAPPKPQPAKAEDVATDYFGAKISDPYRWIEAGPSDPKVMDFLKAQSAYTRSLLDSLTGREALLHRIEQLDNAIPTVRSWQRGGTDLFYLETAPGAKTSSLYVRDAGLANRASSWIRSLSNREGNMPPSITSLHPGTVITCSPEFRWGDGKTVRFT